MLQAQMQHGPWLCYAQVLLAYIEDKGLDQMQQMDEPEHACSRKQCGGCCIWNWLLTGHQVFMHIPGQRVTALLVKALLGLHAQALTAANLADLKVT